MHVKHIDCSKKSGQAVSTEAKTLDWIYIIQHTSAPISTCFMFTQQHLKGRGINMVYNPKKQNQHLYAPVLSDLHHQYNIYPITSNLTTPEKIIILANVCYN